MADTWLDDKTKKELEDYIARGATPEDLEAAGYTKDQLFQVGYFDEPVFERPQKDDQVNPKLQGSIQEYNPTQREDYRVGLSTKLEGFGLSKNLADDISESVMGTTTPSDGSLGIGLADFTPLGAMFAGQEGARTFKRGWNTGSKTDMALGALEAVGGAAEALPGVNLMVRGAKTLADKAVDAYDPTVMRALLGKEVPMYKESKRPLQLTNPVKVTKYGIPKEDYDLIVKGHLEPKAPLSDISQEQLHQLGVENPRIAEAISDLDLTSSILIDKISYEDVRWLKEGRIAPTVILEEIGFGLSYDEATRLKRYAGDVESNLDSYLASLEEVVNLVSEMPEYKKYEGVAKKYLDDPSVYSEIFDHYTTVGKKSNTSKDNTRIIAEFQSPVPEALEAVYDNVFAGKQGKTIKGSQLIKEIQDNHTIRKSEWDSLGIDIQKDKNYTGEEILGMVELAKNKWRTEARFVDQRYGGYQRQDITDPEKDYYEITINSESLGGTNFRAKNQHFDKDTLSHTRASKRTDQKTGEDYILVEELQSDLLQHGYEKPVVGTFDAKSFAEFAKQDRAGSFARVKSEFNLSDEDFFSAVEVTKKFMGDAADAEDLTSDNFALLRNYSEDMRKIFFPEKPPLSNEQLRGIVYSQERLVPDIFQEFSVKKDSSDNVGNLDRENGIDEQFVDINDLDEDFEPLVEFDERTNIGRDLENLGYTYSKLKRNLEQDSNLGLPPIRKTEEGVKLSIQALMAKADKEGVDKIVLPPFERIVEKRFPKDSQAYENALDPKNGFYATYVKSLNKVLTELQTTFGDGIKITQKELPYPDGENVKPLNTIGVEIDISGIRDKYDLSKPRFAQGGMVESNMIDPVSKNPVPPGAKPEEVRDDVDIKASEGEYIIPANVVRFLGLDKLEKLVSNAQKKLAELSEAGRIGGAGAEDLPFSAEELAAVEDTAPATQAPRMAQGGLIQPEVPSVPAPTTPQPPAPPVYRNPILENPDPFAPVNFLRSGMLGASGLQGRPTDESDDSRDNPIIQDKTRMSRGVEEWMPEDFGKYQKQRGDLATGMVEAGISKFMPFGGRLLEMRHKYLEENVPKAINKMLSTGVDNKGNALTDVQKEQLRATLEAVNKPVERQTPKSVVGGALKDLFGMDKKKAKEEPKQQEEKKASDSEKREKKSESDRTSSTESDRSEEDKEEETSYARGGLVSRKRRR